MLFGTHMSGMHLTYCLMASQLLCFPLFFLARDTFRKLFSYSCRPLEYLWEFQSIPLIMYLSLECCVRNHNSPHILRIINSQAIAGKFSVTAYMRGTSLKGCQVVGLCGWQGVCVHSHARILALI